MTRIVEISAEGVAGVRADLVATRDALDGLGPLRHRAAALGVSTSGFDEALGIADRLGTTILPVVDMHLARARTLADLRYGGVLGPAIPVVDDEAGPFAPVPPFGQSTASGGGAVLTWEPEPAEEHEADQADTEKSRGIGDWFEDRWDDVTDAADAGRDWLAATAVDAWDAALAAGAPIGDWWESTTADLGGWIDENATDLRGWVGQHVGLFRFLASACRNLGLFLVIFGAVLTVALAVIGGVTGFGAGTVVGGPLGVPAGAAGVAAGATVGLKTVGLGFTLVSVGDFLDVAADWGEGTIDGQDLVKQGSVELTFAITAMAGVGVVGKLLQKAVAHLPPAWRRRIDDWLAPISPVAPQPEVQRLAPLRSTAPTGLGWTRRPDYGPDPLYGQPRPGSGPLSPENPVPSSVDPGLAAIGADLTDLWGVNPATGRPFTEAEWMDRFATGTGDIRWPPNGGAAPGTRVVFDDAEEFIDIYGNQVDRVGDEDGGYLGIPPGVPFDHRSLPPTTIGSELHTYRYTGRLPPGTTIEVSEIAPAFGRPGGGIQVRFMKGNRSIPVAEMRRRGILR